MMSAGGFGLLLLSYRWSLLSAVMEAHLAISIATIVAISLAYLCETAIDLHTAADAAAAASVACTDVNAGV